MTSIRHTTTASCAALALLGACASGGSQAGTDVGIAPAPQQITTAQGQNIRFNTTSTTVAVTELIPVAVDSAFNLLMKVYADLQIPTTNIDSRQRMVGNSSFKVRRRLGGVTLTKYLDCGAKDGVDNADSYDIVLTVNSAVGGTGPTTSTITTRVDGVATHPVFSTQTSCSTKGELEKRIALAVKTKAAGGK